MQPPNEELSLAAQALLDAHRAAHAPAADHSERVWARVQHSILAAPLAVELDAAAADPSSVVGAQATAVAVTKSGVLGSAAAKAILVTTIGAAGVGVIAQDRVVDAIAPAPLVQPPLREPSHVKPGLALSPSRPASLPLVPASVPPRPSLSPAAARPVSKAETQSLALTPELAAQLSRLSRVDTLIRQSSYKEANRELTKFRDQYPNSVFQDDKQALEMVLFCRLHPTRPAKGLETMLSEPRFRRYKHRLKRACMKE